jgi:hypothetical protein
MRMDRSVGARSSATGIGWVVVAAAGLAGAALTLAVLVAWLA